MFKIPVLDEVVRSFQSLGDAITGDTDAAAARWKNWTNDSFLATGGKMVGLAVASGATAMVGKTDIAADLIEKAGDNGEKFGATALSAVSHVGGIAAQAFTLGIPNPVSGALNGVASGINEVVDKDAQGETNGISWNKLGTEVGVGAAKGAASAGGIIPYAGTAVEQAIRGEKIEFDHKQEWANWGLNVGLSVATAGTVKGTTALTEAGKIGVKRAVAIGGTSGLAMGTGAAIISQEVHSAALDRKMLKKGYRHDRDETLDDGKEYAVYTKEGEEDVFVPKPSKGDIVAQGLMQGVTQGAAAGFQVSKQLEQKEFLKQNYKKRLTEVSEIPDDHVLRGSESTPKKSVSFSDMEERRASSISSGSRMSESRASSVPFRARMSEGRASYVSTGSEISASSKLPNTAEYLASKQLAQELGLKDKYVKLTRRAIEPGAEKGIIVLGNENGRDLFLLQHASDGEFGKFGPFKNPNPEQIRDTLRKAVNPQTKTVNLLGCDVSPEMASQLQRLYSETYPNAKVNILRKGTPGVHRLYINWEDNFYRYWSLGDPNDVLSGPLSELPQHLRNVVSPE